MPTRPLRRGRSAPTAGACFEHPQKIIGDQLFLDPPSLGVHCLTEVWIPGGDDGIFGQR